LERYLALARPGRPTFVTLIANQATEVPPEVREHPRFLAPRRTVPHLLWEDFYPLVAGVGTRLARDFAAYMRHLGMDPWTSAWGDPFASPEAGRAFRRAWEPVRRHYKARGATRCAVDPTGLGIAIREPLPALGLLHLTIQRTLAPRDPRLGGRVACARFWLPPCDPTRERLHPVAMEFAFRTFRCGRDPSGGRCATVASSVSSPWRR
jgi:hypothetical protein